MSVGSVIFYKAYNLFKFVVRYNMLASLSLLITAAFFDSISRLLAKFFTLYNIRSALLRGTKFLADKIEFL